MPLFIINLCLNHLLKKKIVDMEVPRKTAQEYMRIETDNRRPQTKAGRVICEYCGFFNQESRSKS